MDNFSVIPFGALSVNNSSLIPHLATTLSKQASSYVKLTDVHSRNSGKDRRRFIDAFILTSTPD